MTILLISLILLIWFRSDAYLEYCRLFGLDFMSFYEDYDKKQKDDITLSDYQLYLRRYHNCFFVKLITCPICLCIWLSLISAFGKILLWTFIAIISESSITTIIALWLVALISIPYIILGSLIIFAIIDRLLK